MKLSIATRWCAVVVVALLLEATYGASRAGSAAGRPAPARPQPVFLQTCVIAAPDPTPLFPGADADGATDDATDDDADDDAETDEDTGLPGVVAPGSGVCVGVAGTVNFGVQRDWYATSALARSTGSVPPGAVSFLPSATLRLETGQTLASGLYVASAFEFQFIPVAGTPTEPVVNEASVTVGPWQFGVASSRFDFWTGDNFNFSARLPNRTVALIAHELALTASTRVSLSLEDVAPQPATTLAAQPTGRRVPDAVARLSYSGDNLTLHAALALRDIAPTATAGARLGRAVIVGATWDGELLGRKTSLTGQYAHAVDAAAYIGSQLDRRVVAAVLLGDDATRGWSGVIALGREWTDVWSSNLYVSRYALAVPLAGALTGRVSLDRVTGNIVWQPLAGFKAGLEASVAWQKLELTGRSLPLGLAGRLTSVQLFLERTF